MENKNGGLRLGPPPEPFFAPESLNSYAIERDSRCPRIQAAFEDCCSIARKDCLCSRANMSELGSTWQKNETSLPFGQTSLTLLFQTSLANIWHLLGLRTTAFSSSMKRVPLSDACNDYHRPVVDRNAEMYR